MATGLGGSIPQINRSGITPGSKALFHSVRDIALIIDKTLKPGYGYLKAGTVMCINTLDAMLVPYPEVAFATNLARAKSFLTSDCADAATTLSITNDESYKFVVGDSIVMYDNTSAAENLGAITNIVRGANGIATITFTTATINGPHTVAHLSCIYAKTDTAAGFSKATYILDQDINTGYGKDAKGANSSVVVSNAVLYKSSMVNYDTQAGTDLGTISDSRLIILK